MGLSYSCVLVRAALEDTGRRVSAIMKKMGYLPAADGEAEVCIYRRPGAAWFCVRCEAFAHEPAMVKLAKRLSEQFQGYALTIEAVDSDFMLLTLSDPETNKTSKACIGVPYDGKKPKPDLAAWRALDPAAVMDTLFFDKAMNAESGLSLLSKAMGFVDEDVLGPELGEVEPTVLLRFASTDKEPLSVQEGPPVLEVSRCPLGPVRAGKTMSIGFKNRNASSVGLDVIVCGPFAVGDEMTFSDPFLHFGDWPDRRFDPNSRHHLQPDLIEAVVMNNGWRGYRFAFGAFVIPPGLNPKQKKFLGQKRVNADFAHQFSFTAYPHMDEKYAFDLCVVAYPRENESGAASWSPTGGKAKEEAIDEYNESLRGYRVLAEKYGGDLSQFEPLDKETYMWEGRV